MAQSRTTNQIERDIETVVGGYFDPDHIGPAAYQDVIRRVQAAPDEYLQAFERMFLRPDADPLVLADLYLPSFLELLASRSPQRVRALGTRLAAIYSRGVPAGRPEDWEALDGEGEPDEPTRKRRRLQKHLAALRVVTRGS